MNRALLTLIALVAAAAAGCSDNAPRLLFAADPSISVALSQSNITVGAPLSFGAIMLCVSAPSSATIQKVSIHDPHGAMQVDAFAVRPNPMASGHEGLGALNIGLAAYGTGFAPAEPQSVRGVCQRTCSHRPARRLQLCPSSASRCILAPVSPEAGGPSI